MSVSFIECRIVYFKQFNFRLLLTKLFLFTIVVGYIFLFFVSGAC